MNLDEAMKALILGYEVGRHTIPEMRLKVVNPKEYPGIVPEHVTNIGDTVVIDLSRVSDDRMKTVYDDIELDEIFTWRITYSEMNADDYYVYEKGKNLTTEQVYYEVMKGNKILNDVALPGGFYIAKFTDTDGDEGPALYYPNEQVVIDTNKGMPWWTPVRDIEFDNYYYIKKE